MKVVTDKDGRMQTVPHSDAAAQAQLARTRRELRDMIAGNTQFHTDELGPTPAAEPVLDLDYDSFLGSCCTPGFDRYEGVFGKRSYA